MEFSVTANPSRRVAYIRPQSETVQAERRAAAPGRDEVAISLPARQAMASEAADAVGQEETEAGTVTTFPSFAQEFAKVTQGYTDTVREHYAREHEENLTFDSPRTHIWDKYKNPDSPDFRADLSEDERAWAYDQELELLRGGSRLQMGNPYAFDGNPPDLASAAMEAASACREQIGQSIGELLAERGVELPEDASFRLTVDPSDYAIHVTGLEDRELAQSIEQALCQGDNGKNLYNHLKLTVPEGEALGVDYAGGRLAAVDTRRELDDKALSEVKKQAGPMWARYSSAYSPHQQAMNDQMLGLNPAPPFNTQENMDFISAAVRVGAPEAIAEFRARQQDLSLVVNQNRDIDPSGSIALQTYMQAYARQAEDTRKTIANFYAEAHAENSAYPFEEGLARITEKYKRPDSPLFRADLTPEQRDMFYRQERALLTGGRLSLYDPYALASAGGIPSAESAHQNALRAALEKLEELRGALG